jgi:hypothetical protein
VTSTDDVKRLGRAIAFVHQHDRKITAPHIRAKIEVLLLTGKAMDFAVRLQGHHDLLPLSGPVVMKYASFAGLGSIELRNTVLPALKQAGIIDYALDTQGEVLRVDEYVGVSASVVEQTVQLLNQLGPQHSDLAFLHSVEVAAIAPLTKSQHLSEVVRRGFTDAETASALQLGEAVGITQSVDSTELGEQVVFSPYVWGTRQIELATFLRNLPPNERDVLLGMSEQVLAKPGVSMSRLGASPAVLRSAQNAGLIQAATVRSAAGGESTYVFSPLLETQDNQFTTSEAFHLRKLFTAHILFGQEKAMAGGGQILDPALLVQRLIERNRVGPATNIGTDYHMLEMAGVVAVRNVGDSDRAYLHLVKKEIAEASLQWIRRITDLTGVEGLKLAQAPAEFTTPEAARDNLGSAGAANELMVSAVLELRKETQRAARRDDPWS